MSQSGGSDLNLELFVELLTQRVPVSLILRCVAVGLYDGADRSSLGEDHSRMLRKVAGRVGQMANELEAAQHSEAPAEPVGERGKR